MICYKKLDIPDHQIISDKMYDFVVNKTSILRQKIFWTYVNIPQVFQHVPELKQVVDSYDVSADAMAVIYAPPGLQGAVHIDHAKDTRILWPIRNCQGSYTRFFDIDPGYIELARLENNEPYYKITQSEPHKVLDNLELTEPVVFDSSIAHGVYTDPQCSEPRLTFTIRSRQGMSHLLYQDR